MTDLLNIIFDDLGIWLLGYGNEISCLYIPQMHYFINNSVAMKYRLICNIFYFEPLKSHFSQPTTNVSLSLPSSGDTEITLHLTTCPT